MRIDWSDGPVACASCARPMRPQGHRPQGRWEGTVTFHQGDGLCHACYVRRAAGLAATGAVRPTVRHDFSAGPLECVSCGRLMRPGRTAASGRWAGTVTHNAHGLCKSCYRRQEAR